jgi:hypothetical protein
MARKAPHKLAGSREALSNVKWEPRDRSSFQISYFNNLTTLRINTEDDYATGWTRNGIQHEN